jgi:hypothetical protein
MREAISVVTNRIDFGQRNLIGRDLADWKKRRKER